jgi:hypothetical protein
MSDIGLWNHTDLSIPEVPLICIMISFISIYFSNKSIGTGRIGVTALWWIVGVLSGVVAFLSFFQDLFV